MTPHRTLARAGCRLAFVLSLGALSFATPATAAVYYVSNGGNDANSGLTVSSAWATISKANSRVVAGDVVIVEDGTYTHFPNPAVTGTGDARITYVGNLSNPAAVKVTTSGNLSRNHVTVKGFELVGGFVLTGHRDSIAFCIVRGSKPQLTGADESVITRCTFYATRFWVVGSETDTTVWAERDTISYCTFVLRPNDLSGHTVRFKTLDGCVFKHLQFDIEIGPEGRGASCTKLFHVKNTLFTDCSWNVVNNRLTDGDEAGWFVLRDMTMNNSFVRDTIVLKGPGPVQFFGAASGTYPGTVMNNNFTDCIIKAVGPADYGYAVYYQDKCQSDTLQNCLIVGQTGGFLVNGVTGQALMDHCTIASFSPWTGTVDFDGNGWQGHMTMTNNIFYTAWTAARVPKSAPLYTNLYTAGGHFSSNYNLFYGPMRRDSTIYGAGFGLSGPGATYGWCTSRGYDCQSVYGDPKFLNTTNPLYFDATPLAGSWAAGTGTGGSDVGAIAFTGSDAEAPATVADVGIAQLGDNFVTLQWTAPGDDDVVGRPSAYDVRFSGTPITDASFATATPVPVTAYPQAAGSLEKVTVFGLTPGHVYYFALRARDEASNWSATSNGTAAMTHPADVTPPASIKDLKPGP
jgi:hypothetical protein